MTNRQVLGGGAGHGTERALRPQGPEGFEGLLIQKPRTFLRPTRLP